MCSQKRLKSSKDIREFVKKHIKDHQLEKHQKKKEKKKLYEKFDRSMKKVY